MFALQIINVCYKETENRSNTKEVKDPKLFQNISKGYGQWTRELLTGQNGVNLKLKKNTKYLSTNQIVI